MSNIPDSAAADYNRMQDQMSKSGPTWPEYIKDAIEHKFWRIAQSEGGKIPAEVSIVIAELETRMNEDDKVQQLVGAVFFMDARQFGWKMQEHSERILSQYCEQNASELEYRFTDDYAEWSEQQ